MLVVAIKLADRRGEREAITEWAETGDDTNRKITEIALLSERLTRMRVGKVHFDERQCNRCQYVAQRHRSMCERGRVDQDEVDAALACRLHPLDQRVLGVGLETLELVSRVRGAALEVSVNLGQGRVTVELRLALPEQIEIRSVQDQQLRHA